MTLAVSFLTYNNSSAPYLADFLPSLEIALAKIDVKLCLLVGDNSDQDFSANEIQVNSFCQNLPYGYEYLRFEKNLGFAKAYNLLISRAKALGVEYFLMLNPDMMLDDQMICTLLKTISNQPELSSVCPKIYYWDFEHKIKTNILDSCGIILKSGLRFFDLGQGQEDDGRYDHGEILGPSGAAALFRMSALEQIKTVNQYFDERFFMYKEDCDLAYRLAKVKYDSILVPSAIAYHDRSLALKRGLKERIIDWQRRSQLSRNWSFKGQHLLFLKHWSGESLFSRLLIIIEIVTYFIFSLLFANFLLKNYKDLGSP